MDTPTKPPHPSGLNFYQALGILFIGLKLGNVIQWSWWLVLLPIYLSLLTYTILVLTLVSTKWGISQLEK